jgi:2-polyprenyl-6-methoxyphenol hydroxylase-like FAD-dependent oxidoreductase
VARIIVLGGGVCGLAAGILLRRDGHEVTVLERDREAVPASVDDAWERWPRDGVTQFRQTHYLTSRGREVLDLVLPDVRIGLVAAGGMTMDPLQMMPPAITDRAPRDGDERFVTVNARRSTVEQVLAGTAELENGLQIRRGVTVTGLVTHAYNGVPHVTGVRTDAGAELTADLVVDAMGRRSQLPRWLQADGAGPVHEEAEDSGFIYYSRYFRARDSGMPEFHAPLLTEMGTFSILTVPADNGTWSVTLYTASGDQPLKRLRDPDAWTRLLAACPLHAHWLDGEPITGMISMGGIVDRYRRLLYGASPVATGVALAGDAWACTNPSQGRGMTLRSCTCGACATPCGRISTIRANSPRRGTPSPTRSSHRGTERRSRKTARGWRKSRRCATGACPRRRPSRRRRCATRCLRRRSMTRTSSARSSARVRVYGGSRRRAPISA